MGKNDLTAFAHSKQAYCYGFYSNNTKKRHSLTEAIALDISRKSQRMLTGMRPTASNMLQPLLLIL
jgi:hypothetical protein